MLRLRKVILLLGDDEDDDADDDEDDDNDRDMHAPTVNSAQAASSTFHRTLVWSA